MGHRVDFAPAPRRHLRQAHRLLNLATCILMHGARTAIYLGIVSRVPLKHPMHSKRMKPCKQLRTLGSRSARACPLTGLLISQE